ncbi:G-type lectin S-receptor-like serine/threonine-protein kinase LECRK1 [Cornus florida]|uniref:G-type lectin S-receptor-like serine/threonine-protein kinase LECRK1 n=1 Tax=Cornus florida TaxID=4283 RepID=UPI00289E1188|nr:G-type lectin S-receptor-like serine/threonine-protein kinase LECRK1 [Cornus florida]
MAPIFCLFLVLITEFSLATAQQRNSIISLGSSLSPASSNSFWSSGSGQFAFGFYPNGDGFSIGIWYATIAPKTVIWTAKRDDPPFHRDSKLLLGDDGRLVLRQGEDPEITIAGGNQTGSSASMLDTGNFVLYNSRSEIVWQSFNAPTDTFLPRQKLRQFAEPKELFSSVSKDDHSTGKFRILMQEDGYLAQYPADSPNLVEYGYWDSGIHGAGNNVTLNFDDKGQLYLLNTSGNIKNLYDGGDVSDKLMYRMTVDADGIFRVYSYGLNRSDDDWTVEWSSSSNKCLPKGLCGQNQYCSLMNQEAVCTCLPGFVLIDEGQKDLGCNRNYVRNGNVSFNFDELDNVAWLENSYSTLHNKSKFACKDECLKDYDCEVVLYKDEKCMKQKLPLKFGRFQLNDQVTTLVKVGSREFKKEKQSKVLIVSVAVLSVAFTVLAISGVLIYKYRVKGYKKLLNGGNDELIEEFILRSFTYGELEQATNGFGEVLGKGASGTVFKGILSNSKRAVAVKRLETVVAEGEREFLNEMKVIGRTHHKNLVKLLGYCHDGTNRLLVYEFMSNGSLADVLFKSETKPRWEERVRIAVNVARGILYLHEECETQIIHCDIKPQNILMDERHCAKVADFGLSKLMNPNQTRTYTGVRGTRGYVAPEWHMNLAITVKADVFSFGIMLLEIICCRRSLDPDFAEAEVILADWVFHCFDSDRLDKLVQDEKVDKSKLERMVRVGIWCIQDDPSLRPSMKKVVLMLEGTVDIPTPPSPTSFISSI